MLRVALSLGPLFAAQAPPLRAVARRCQVGAGKQVCRSNRKAGLVKLPPTVFTFSLVWYSLCATIMAFQTTPDMIIDPALIDQNVKPSIHRHELARSAPRDS